MVKKMVCCTKPPAKSTPMFAKEGNLYSFMHVLGASGIQVVSLMNGVASFIPLYAVASYTYILVVM